jgi:hypothetical protein
MLNVGYGFSLPTKPNSLKFEPLLIEKSQFNGRIKPYGSFPS